MTKKENSETLAALKAMKRDDLIISSAAEVIVWPPLPTGILSLDLAIGKGLPRGQVIEIFGPPGQGKTTAALVAIAEAQAGGLETAFVNAEHRFNPAWAAQQGVNLERLMVIDPLTAEDALSAIEVLARNGTPLTVVDSVAALTPKAEMDGEMEDNAMGVMQRLMRKALGKTTGYCARAGATLVLLNQVRSKIGVVYGNPEFTPGGKSIEFQASVRIEMKRTAWIEEEKIRVGNRTRARVVKNSTGAPWGEAEFDIYYGKCTCHAAGVDRTGDIFDLAVARGIIEKAGAWFSLDGERLGQGRVAAIAALGADAPRIESIRRAVRG